MVVSPHGFGCTSIQSLFIDIFRSFICADPEKKCQRGSSLTVTTSFFVCVFLCVFLVDGMEEGSKCH